MPGEHTSNTTHGAEKSTSGERRQLLHGIVDHIYPLLRDTARGPLSLSERYLLPISRYSTCSNSKRNLVAASTGALRILAVRLQRAPNTSVSGSGRCLIPPPVGRKHSKNPTPTSV